MTHSPAQSAGVLPIEARQSRETRRAMSGPAMRTFFNIAQRWGLTTEEQRGLLGWPPQSTFYKYKAGDVPALPYDTLTRISLVIGIFKALHILYPEARLADSWIKLPNANPMFGGHPPMAFLCNRGMDGLLQVRRLLDARRGGWN
jgi:hypothetical protein